MEGLPDTAAFATRLKNTLIQYHSIEDDKWRVAKKMVNWLNYFYLGVYLLCNQFVDDFQMVWKNMEPTWICRMDDYASKASGLTSHKGSNSDLAQLSFVL